MASDEKGSGGLFFGPPEARGEEPQDIGFAPDLDEGAPGPALFDALPEPPRAARPTAYGRAPLALEGQARAARYPLAEAALARLLGDVGAPSRDDAPDGPERRPGEGAGAPPGVGEPTGAPPPGDAGFAIGPSIMRPPPDIARRPAPRASAASDEGPRARTDALMEDMVDMVLVGDDDGRPEIHLSFKEDVFGGLYLRLERREDGLFAHFHVADDRARRQVESYAGDLLARLSSRGLRIAGWDVVVRED